MSPPIKTHRSPRSEEKKRLIDGNLPAFHSALTDWFQQKGRDLPWRHTHDPYAILVSEVMLQQTQVATVIDYYQRWMVRFPDASTLAAAPENDVLHAWQGLGYYSRARNLHKAAQALVRDHGGTFPSDPEAIRALPGVGRYTAAAVATFAFDAPIPPVDGNIARVLARLLDFYEPVDSSAGLEHLWETATRWQPERGAGFYNEAMMELGALVCTPRSPVCETCPVEAFCAATDPELLPIKKPRRKTVLLDEHCAWALQDGRVLLEQQTGTRWRGLWRLPVLAKAGKGTPLVTLDYPFTHHRITLRVFPFVMDSGESRQWFSLADLADVPMPAPHRRALKQLLRQAALQG
jgi:A/G-specific adenine glycosylase